MRISLASAFQDSERYIDRFFAQVEFLRICLEEKGHHLRLVVGEGDSKDYTRQALLERLDDEAIFVDLTHGGNKYGSVVDSQRWLQCAYVGNLLLMNIPHGDLDIYVESDLIWTAYDMMKLLAGATSGFDIVAPKVILKREGYPENTWYDTWAFRQNGLHFGHKYPYHDAYVEGEMVEVESAGSCLVTSDYLMKKGWFTVEGSIVGLCNVWRNKGYHIYLDTRTEVRHE